MLQVQLFGSSEEAAAAVVALQEAPGLDVKYVSRERPARHGDIMVRVKAKVHAPATVDGGVR